MAQLLTILVACVVTLLTLMPQLPGPEGIPGLDKVAHFMAFAALAAPLSWRYPHLWRAVALATIAYGGLIEIVQPWTGRDAEWSDLLADGAGACAGTFAASRFGNRRFGGA